MIEPRVAVATDAHLRGGEFIAHAVDVHVHSEPDLLARRGDDVSLAIELGEAGYAMAVHRHHFSVTADRAAIAQRVSGFQLLGAVVLNECVGGLTPAVVEVALRMGAVLVSLPTLSACHFRSLVPSMPAQLRNILSMGSCVPVVDGNGRPLPALIDVIDLVRDHGAVLSTGYLAVDELHAVVSCAVQRGVGKIVVSNPTSPAMQLPLCALEEVLGLGDQVFIEISAYQVGHPAAANAGPNATDAAAAAIRLAGVARTVLSSDGGIASAPPPHELLGWLCAELVDRGFDTAAVTRMTRSNPRDLVAAT
jgi:hypothetical protein